MYFCFLIIFIVTFTLLFICDDEKVQAICGTIAIGVFFLLGICCFFNATNKTEKYVVISSVIEEQIIENDIKNDVTYYYLKSQNNPTIIKKVEIKNPSIEIKIGDNITRTKKEFNNDFYIIEIIFLDKNDSINKERTNE